MIVSVLAVEKEEEDAWYWAVPYYRNTSQEALVRWVAGFEKQQVRMLVGIEDMGMLAVVVAGMDCIVGKVLAACLYNWAKTLNN